MGGGRPLDNPRFHIGQLVTAFSQIHGGEANRWLLATMAMLSASMVRKNCGSIVRSLTLQ